MIISLAQKAAYFNNSESKNTTTLHFRGGKGSVDLKTNHAQSRSRYSMTTVMALRAPWAHAASPSAFQRQDATRYEGFAGPAKRKHYLDQFKIIILSFLAAFRGFDHGVEKRKHVFDRFVHMR